MKYLKQNNKKKTCIIKNKILGREILKEIIKGLINPCEKGYDKHGNFIH